jgi:anthranilate phosphoribosyltransferase
MVVHSDDGLDEISISDKTLITELKNNIILSYSFAPEDVNLPRANLEDIVGGNADDNARITIEILDGQEGPKRNIVLLNAGAALLVGGKARIFPEAVALAAQAIDSGAARKKLEQIKQFTRKLGDRSDA